MDLYTTPPSLSWFNVNNWFDTLVNWFEGVVPSLMQVISNPVFVALIGVLLVAIVLPSYRGSGFSFDKKWDVDSK